MFICNGYNEVLPLQLFRRSVLPALTANNSTTVDVDGLSGDEASIRRGQEDVGRTQFGGHTDSTNRCRVLVPFLQGVLVHCGFLERSPRKRR